MRRSLAVFIDFWVWIAFAGVAGAVLGLGNFALVFAIVIDGLLTAFWGISVGRAVTGIRVARRMTGGSPGLGRGMLRALVVWATGWLGLVVFSAGLSLKNSLDVFDDERTMWWDSIAGTRMVRDRG